MTRDGKVEDGEKTSTTDIDTNAKEEGRKRGRWERTTQRGRRREGTEESTMGGREKTRDGREKRMVAKEHGQRESERAWNRPRERGETERVANGNGRRNAFPVDRGRKWTQRWSWSVGFGRVIPSDERFAWMKGLEKVGWMPAKETHRCLETYPNGLTGDQPSHVSRSRFPLQLGHLPLVLRFITRPRLRNSTQNPFFSSFFHVFSSLSSGFERSVSSTAIHRVPSRYSPTFQSISSSARVLSRRNDRRFRARRRRPCRFVASLRVFVRSCGRSSWRSRAA